MDKRYTSVIKLSARYALLPTLIASILGAAASVLLLLYSVSDNNNITYGTKLDEMLWGVAGGAVLLSVLLMMPMRERGGTQPLYTLRRLGISETAVFFLQSAVYAAAVFIYLCVQAAVCFAWALAAQSRGEGSAGVLTAIISITNSEVGHTLLPLGDLTVYVRTLLLCILFGMCGAYSAFIGRRGRTPVSPFVMLAAAVIVYGFRSEPGLLELDLLASFIYICFIAGISASVKSHDPDRSQLAAEELEEAKLNG